MNISDCAMFCDSKIFLIKNETYMLEIPTSILSDRENQSGTSDFHENQNCKLSMRLFVS